MLSALDHDGNRVTRVIVGSKAAKPGDGVLLAIQHRLRGAGLARDLYVLQAPDAARAAIFVDHFPKAVPNDLDFIRRKIVPEIGAHFRRRRNGDLAVVVQDR